MRPYRSAFPITERLIHLNHAGVTPLCRPAAEAMQNYAQEALDFGPFHYDKWLKTYADLRSAAARLVHGTPEEIAIVKNTTEGIATVALGIDWRPGDRIVLFKEEFPSNQYQWQRLESKGVKIEWLSAADPLDRIDEAARGARLLAISFVQFLSGYRADLVRIGEICRRRGAIFFVDAIQGLGAFPVDVQAANIDALAADGHKWLTGPEGLGILYISQAMQERVEPVEFGWASVARVGDYGFRDMTPHSTAARYECGTLNTISCYGLLAAIEFLLGVGIGNIAEAVRSLGDQAADGARRKGYELLSERTPATGAGIVSFRKPGIESASIVQKLRDEMIIAVPRAGWVRVSPHFYIAPEEIGKMIDLLP